LFEKESEKGAASSEELDQIIKKQIKNIVKEERLTLAAYFSLRAKLHTDEKNVEYFLSQSYIHLAIFCKHNGLLSDAANYYEVAYNILSKNPLKRNSAKLQLANSYECKAKLAKNEGKFKDSMTFYDQASKLFQELKKPREANFCECSKLRAQAIEQSALGEHFSASVLLKKASESSKQINEKLSVGFQADSLSEKGKHEKKNENYEGAINSFDQASQLFQKIGLLESGAWCKGESFECKAYILKNDIKQPYSEIAKAFFQAFEYYPKSAWVYKKVCEADAYKYQGLDAKTKGNLPEAARHFAKAKNLYYNLIKQAKTSETWTMWKKSAIWCEGIETECVAESMFLKAIPKRGEMKEVNRLLARASRLLSDSAADKQAEMTSGLIFFVKAVEAFHKQDLSNANVLLQEARMRLPAEFVYSLLKDEINLKWQPLRYTLQMLESFNKYLRKFETEKGYSFESRVRELFRSMYSQYVTIEGKYFVPEEDEIGIVFDDKTPIEIDAIGTRKLENKWRILIGEIKNLTQPVDVGEVSKFIKKIRFVEQRYRKIAKLESIDKPEIEEKIFVSASGFSPAALDCARRNNVKTINKTSLIGLFKKFHIHPIPK